MSTSTTVSRTPSIATEETVAPPSWVDDWVDENDVITSRDDAVLTCVSLGKVASLVTVRVPDCRGAGAVRFHDQVIQAYRAVRRAVDASGHPHVVRIWNHLPGIHDEIDPPTDRYVTFNAARYTAMLEWFGSIAILRHNVPAASGVGHSGDDLVIHALTMKHPGKSIENPAQIPAYCYSKTYGALPPCFARATRVDTPQPTLFIAGTAAILGEQSQFKNDLDRQVELTLDNLSGVIGQALTTATPLRLLRHVRVYVPNATTAGALSQRLSNVFAEATPMQFVRADLCRRDLLVEVEGIAALGDN